MLSLDGIPEMAFCETFEEVFGRQIFLDSCHAPSLELPTETGFFLPYQGVASLGTIWDCTEAQVQQHEVQAPPVLLGEWPIPEKSLKLGEDERCEDDRGKAKKAVRTIRRQRRKRYVPGPYQTCQWKIVPTKVPGLQLTHTKCGSYLNLHCNEFL